MQLPVVIIEKSEKIGGFRNAYESMLYHGVLLADRKRVENVIDERNVLTRERKSQLLGLVYNLATHAQITQPKASLVADLTAAGLFSRLHGWESVPLDYVEFIEAPLEKYAFEATTVYRLEEMWPEKLIMSLPRVKRPSLPEFAALISPRLPDILRGTGIRLEQIAFTENQSLIDLPCEPSLFEKYPAFRSGLAYVFRKEIWVSIEHLFPQRYWGRRELDAANLSPERALSA